MSARDEWRRGWPLVVAGLAGALVASTPSYSVGVFMKSFQIEFGWGRGVIASAFSIMSLLGGIAAIGVGVAVDRFGARPVGLIGVVAACIAFAGLSQIEGTLLSYWLHWTIVAFGISLCTFIVWTKSLVAHFSKSHGLAMSLVICGTTLAGVITAILASFLIAEFGWWTAFAVHGGILFVVCFPAIFFLFRDVQPAQDAGESADSNNSRDEKADVGAQSGMAVRGAVRTSDFWMLAASFLLVGGAVACLRVHLIPLFEDRGISPYYAAVGLSVMSMTAVAGRITVVHLLDKFNGRKIASATFCFVVVPCRILLSIPGGIIGTFTAAMFFSVSLGSATSLVPSPRRPSA